MHFIKRSEKTIINHVKKVVDSDLRDSSEAIGKNSNQSLISDNSLKDLIKIMPDQYYGLCKHVETKNEQFQAYRKGIFSDKKVFLNDQAFRDLPAKYEDLRQTYKVCRKDYQVIRDAFFKINRGAGSDAWKKYWEEICDEKYPTLFQTDELENYTPAELAYQHLASLYDHSPAYMEKLVRNAKQQTNETLPRMKNADD